ncbi:MAG: DUF962 domain-containing protein [Crocinitomicaceae bacterium]|nr:DUF962 domain-containing protein [Crocinitomicaceae bacterium]
MKNLDQWLKEYGTSHQNKTNKLIHYFCVPLIYFSIVGMLLCIPLGFLKESGEPSIINWASLALIPILYFYARLSLKMAVAILLFSVFCIFINIQLSSLFSIALWKISVFLFVIAWIFQFYGHKIEGQKPSFLEDIQFLLIGPAWIINALFFKK